MKYISILILAVVVLSCSTAKKSTKNNKVAEASSTEYKFDLSLQTKMFLQEYENEKEGKNVEDFIPSQKLIDKYNIKVLDNIYTISGFIKVNNEYAEDKLTQLNINPASKVDNIVTVIIPLDTIDKFLIINGIDYFEISEKVELKTK